MWCHDQTNMTNKNVVQIINAKVVQILASGSTAYTHTQALRRHVPEIGGCRLPASDEIQIFHVAIHTCHSPQHPERKKTGSNANTFK
jgi:hypothetical protein